jgi:type VI secretion system protein ImpL
VEKALEALVAPAVREMEGRLVEQTETRQGEFLPYFTLFRGWRLLTEPSQMASEDAPLVGDEMMTALAPRLAFASPDDRERFPKLVQTQVDFLIANKDLVSRLIPDYYRSSNPELVARGADRLRETWDSSAFYRQLLAEVEPQTKAIDLAALAGPTGLLAGGSPVPGPFTREGWEKLVMPGVQAYRAQMERDWVVAQAFQGRPPDLGRDLLTAYAKDYTDHWVRFLDELTVVPPRDMPEAAELLKAAAQSDSPLLRVMQGVKDQTSLAVDPGIELGAVGRDFVILHEFFDSAASGDPKKRVTSLLSRFVDKLRGGGKGEGEDLLDRNQSPSALYQKLLLAAHEKVSAAAQPGVPVSAMKALMAEGDEATNPLKQVVAWAQLLADGYEGCAAAPAVARVLQLPVTGAKQVVRGGVRKDLNTKWTLLVLQPFQRTLAGKYPLAEGGPDAALFDFTEFFRPGGTFWSFYDQELSQYLFEDGTARSPELDEAPFSSELTQCLQRAHEIREAFFAADPSAASVRFSVRTSPPRIEGAHVNVRWVSFDVGGEFATYSMGAQQWQPMTWPGKDPAAGAALRAHVSGGPPVKGLEQRGPWGLFRLLDQSQFGQVDRSTPTGTWRLSAGESRLIVVYEFQPTSARHPFQPGFLRFRLPESL